MIAVDAIAMPLLLEAAQSELVRLEAVESTLDGSGDDWPPGYDSNDIQLYEVVIQILRDAVQTQAHELDLSSKLLWFLLDLVPDYVQTNRQRISTAQYEALKSAYSHQPESRRVPFPQ
jgi:hypothetical protein